MKLVLIPGLDGTGDLFAPFVDALVGVECRIIAYPPDREMNYAEHEAFVREHLPATGDFVLLAESFSGPVGVSIAAAPPANLRGLILCCSFASNPLPVFGPLSRLIAVSPAIKVPPACRPVPLRTSRYACTAPRALCRHGEGQSLHVASPRRGDPVSGPFGAAAANRRATPLSTGAPGSAGSTCRIGTHPSSAC
jgi:pimeloyl-ACP methyl ester carboxylesterase